MIVAVCDDEELFRKDMTELLVEYKKARRLPLDIVEFSSGTELLEYEYPCDIVLLDYDMPGIDGMQTARALREKKSLCCIIFATAYSEYVFDAYEVNTYRYLVKPITHEKLAPVIDSYIRERKMLAPITLYVDGEQLTVSSESIIYLEADGRSCTVRTDKKALHSSKTLMQLDELLPRHCFYRTHKSYTVNFYYISAIKENTVILTNGERVLISRKRAGDFKKAYKEFVKHFICRT